MTVFWLSIYLDIGWYSFILIFLGFVAMYILNRVVSVCLDRIARLLKFLEEKTYQREAGIIGFLFLFVGFILQFAGAFFPIIQPN